VWTVPMRRSSVIATAIVVLALCITTRQQISHWQDSISLYEHALAVTDNNHIAHNNLAIELASVGRTGEAKQHYLDALHIKPRYSVAHNGLGVLLASQGDVEGAIDQYEMALACDPDFALAHRNLASQLLASGRADEAMQHLERAVALRST